MGILILMSFTVLLALIDIGIKFYVEGNIAQGEEHEILDKKIIIRKVYNKGFALNAMEDHTREVRVISAFVTVILTIYQLFWLLKSKHPIRKLGLSMMTAGAWSNTFDRWVRHYVVDYFGFKTKWEKFTRITFNLGDMFLFVGGILYALTFLYHGKRRSL